MSYHGDFAPASVVYFKFNTAQFSDGAPVTLAGTPALSVYKDDGTTESTTGITLTVDLDTRTGMHQAKIDTSADGTFYAAGHDFDVVITTGTVGGTSVVGRVVGSFSLNNRSALRPATAGRTLVVDAAGLADANMVKMGPTGTGTAQTARDIGASVLLSAGTGTGQLDFTSGVVKSNVVQSLGVAVTNFDGTIAAATATTVTLPALDAGGNTVPDSGQYAYRVLYINGGTGLGQYVYLTTTTGTARQYNVLSGTMPTTVSTDSTYVDVGGWRANTIQVGGTGQTGADLGSLATTINSSVGTPTDLGTGATLSANNVDMAGASFATATDSQHAIRARGDAAWTTATGFSTFNAATDKVFLGDGAHGGTATVITLERMIGASTTTNQPCVKFTGNGTGQGIYALGGASASGFRSEGGATAGFGIHAVATAAGHDGIRGDASGTGGDGIAGNASGTSGHGMHATGSGASGIGMVFTGNTEDIQLGNSSADTLSAAILKAGSITATVAPNLDAAISTRAATGAAMTLTSAGLDAVLIESGISAGASLTDDAGTQLTSINARQALSLNTSALAGVLAGAAGPSTTTKPAGNSGGNTRVTASVDATGRTAVTLKVPT